MKQDKGRGLIRIALVLTLAGYCVASVALVEDSVWVDSSETNIFQEIVPRFYLEGGGAMADADRITLTSDLKGAHPQDSEANKRLHSGDKLTVGWEIGGTEGDVDLGGSGDNAKTIDTTRWMNYKDARGRDPKELVTKATSYTLTDADRGRYIGIETTSTMQASTSNVGTALHLYDVSTASNGGSDSDSIAPGPVVNQNLRTAIFVDGTSISLIDGGTPIELGKTYVTKLYSDENKNDKFDVGTDTDVTASYDFRWVLSSNSQQLGTSDGIVNSSFSSNNLVILATDDETRTNLNGPARNGKEAPSIPANSDGVQDYKLHIIYKRK